jgi:ubiquinone/menaquinone biosynthesis C-methylase UbiE
MTTAQLWQEVGSRLTGDQVAEMDPYVFMAVLGKHVIHPGGRQSTQALIDQAGFQDGQQVLDVGCGVATTALEIARRHAVQLTAVDISPHMLARARRHVAAATGLRGQARVAHGDVLALDFPDGAFDRVIAEAVTMFVDRPRAAQELVRVCRPGGRVLATEFLWRKPPTPEARRLFLGEVCPGLTFDSEADWVRLYTQAGLTDLHVTSGQFAMMTPAGFLADEGWANVLRILLRTLSRPVYVRKMVWLMTRMARVVPYLGYIAISGTKPPAG